MSMKECAETARALRIKRLRYQSWHRGCKETDMLLGLYCDHYLPGLGDDALDRYEAFLNEYDADIWAWVAYKEPCPKQEYQPLIIILQSIIPDSLKPA